MIEKGKSRLPIVLILAFVLPCLHACMSLRVGFIAQKTLANGDAKTLNSEAHELIGKGKYAEAIEKARQATEIDPNFGEAYKNLALAYCDSGQPEAGMDPAQHAVKLVPNLDKAHHVMGKIFLKLGRFEDATREFQQAIKINPQYAKAYFLLGCTYDQMNDIDRAKPAFEEAIKLDPSELEYQTWRDSLKIYGDVAKSGSLPTLQLVEGKEEYSLSVYTTVFYEAFIHRNYDLLERAAAQARSSRERIRGGNWKLDFVYEGFDTPIDPALSSDQEWVRHLDMLQAWCNQRPDSITARVALASSWIEYGWRARGMGPARSVSAGNFQLFHQRLARAREILTHSSRSKEQCPQWYSLMLRIAQGEGWDRNSYEDLFNRAVSFEPGYEGYYTSKAYYLLPRWYGQPGDLENFFDSLRNTRDGHGPMHYFLLSEAIADYAQNEILIGNRISGAVIKQGFLDLQKTYGATNRDLNWACFMAMRFQDKAFTKKLLAQIGEEWDASIWKSYEGIIAARKWSTS